MSETHGLEILDFRPSMRQTMVITERSVETGGKVSRVELDLEADQSGPPAHLHPQQREVYAVDHGALTVTLDGEAHVISAGQSIEVPTGAAHTYANRSDEPVRFSAEHEPALDFEEYIRLVHRTRCGEEGLLAHHLEDRSCRELLCEHDSLTPGDPTGDQQGLVRYGS
jgi:mannose-6-phosphate isomerase-like protein (cupin superfamily)